MCIEPRYSDRIQVEKEANKDPPRFEELTQLLLKSVKKFLRLTVLYGIAISFVHLHFLVVGTYR